MNEIQKEEMQYILVTDVGSTTTKARLFHYKKNEWRFLVAGEAPTTVESPFEDVTLGVQNAIREIEELTGHIILSQDNTGILIPHKGNSGVDLYCTTSSAGGGLQMMVVGLIKSMTAESANRAGLGAGAIVMDVIATDDGRHLHEKIQRIRNLRPDMILLAGGTDGGAEVQVIELVELLNAADPKPRLGANYKLPLIYAGNKEIRSQIAEMIAQKVELTMVENLRPKIDIENTDPARISIHELFMEHVMSHAPGYTKLMKWTEVDIMPTPAGEGLAMQLIADTFKENVLGVGLGGATTNVYSIFDGNFVRSVSANLGMSYSITNVMKEAGIDNIMRWIPFKIDDEEVSSRLMNKMIRPTTIPQTQEDLIIEHAVAREALRLGLDHHKTIATRLKGIRREMDIATIFKQKVSDTYIDMMNIDTIAGTGGLLSHAPERIQSMIILIDAWQPEGITKMFQDSVFMMPHLGVLSTVFREAAWNIFDKDCLIPLGSCVAPKGIGKPGIKVMDIVLETQGGETVTENLNFGEIKCLTLAERKEAKIIVTPINGFDMGLGPNQKFSGKVMGGVVGLILDARGRPIYLPEEEKIRKETIVNWNSGLNLYPIYEKEEAI